MKSLVLLPVSLLAAGLLSASVAPPPEMPEAGEVAPEIDAKTWFNSLGTEPTLASLRGHAVMIEFWATWCGPCVAAWPHVEELHREYEAEGLVVLGLSAEEPGVVEGFVEKTGYTARIAAGSSANGRYGITGIPHTYLIAPDGTVVWHGHPGGLTKGMIEDVLKTAKPLPPDGFLAFVPSVAETKALARALEAVTERELGKALAAAESVAADEDAGAADREAARTLVTEIGAHVERVLADAQKLVDRLDLLRALTVYEQIADKLGRTPYADTARERAGHIEKDERLGKELDAFRALEKVRKRAERLSTSKRAKKLEEFADKHAGTKAAERARAIASAK